MIEESNKIYDNEDLISDPNTPARPKWAEKIIQAAREPVGNPSDPRRTRSQFQSALFVKEPFFDDKFYLMVESYPKTYEQES